MIREAKRRTYFEGMDFYVDQDRAWVRVRACGGRRKDGYTSMIKGTDDMVVAEPEGIADVFNVKHVRSSSDDELTVYTLRHKYKILEGMSNTTLISRIEITSPISPVSFTELNLKIARLKGKTPGRDRIS